MYDNAYLLEVCATKDLYYNEQLAAWYFTEDVCNNLYSITVYAGNNLNPASNLQVRPTLLRMCHFLHAHHYQLW